MSIFARTVSLKQSNRSKGRSNRARSAIHRAIRRAAAVEMLESRTLLSASAHPAPDGVPLSQPTLISTPDPIKITLGTSSPLLSDDADLESGNNPTGSILFTLKGEGLNNTDTISVSGDGIYTGVSNLFTSGQVAGSYTWDAQYSGDQTNHSASAITQTVEVDAASPTLSSTPSTTAVTLGPTNVPLTDSTVLSGGYFETGTITFTLLDSTNTVVDTETATVNGNGTYSTSTGFTPLVPGTYQWDVSYSGDDNNNQTSDDTKTTEQVVVSTATPTLTTTPDPTSAVLIPGSTTLKDAADLEKGDDPGGSITFTLFDPSDKKVDTETVPVTGNGSYSTPTGYAVPVGATGTYQWDATYNGDQANKSVSDTNDSTEQVIVSVPVGANSISGTAYTDELGDGFSSDDTPLQGLTIDLFQNGGTTPFATTLTAVDGTYKFNGLLAGTYKVQEELPAGWMQTVGKSGYTKTFSDDNGNGTFTGNNFENFQNFSVGGTADKDITGNGPSSDDTPFSGIPINLFVNGGTTPIQTIPTAADGTYLFTNLGPGDYRIKQVVPAGYTDTGGIGGYEFLAVSDGNGGGLNFDDHLNPATASIAGKSYQDITGNGITSDDTIVGGVTINLFKNGSSTPFKTTTTASNGNYSFTGLSAATYQVLESVPSGWTRTTSSSGYNVVVAAGKTYTGKNFANFKNISISGIKFNDLTGNGFSSDDTHLGGVKIELFKNNGSSTYKTTSTASNGTYSFTNLGPGTYKVEEVIPSGYIQTGGGPSGSAGKTYYSLSAQSGKNATTDNFDDYKIPTAKPKSFYFTINHGSTKYTTLSGHTHKGDTVTVTFTVPSGANDVLTLVSYTAVSSTFSSSTAHEEKIYKQATGTFAAGTHSMTITIPNGDYQINFVSGPAISQLEPPSAGPDSQNITYGAEDRLLSAD